MLIPVSLSAYNFVLYRKLQIKFKQLNDNLIFIVGENLDTGGTTSNGAGKTLIADLMTDTMFDKTIRKHSQKSFIGKFEDHCIQAMVLVDSVTGDRYGIKKYRNHPKKGNKLLFYVTPKGTTKQKNLSKKTKRNTYAVIQKTLGLTWETFKNRNYFGQGDTERFLYVPDSKKADIITDIVGIRDFQKCKDETHKNLRWAEDKIGQFQVELDSMKDGVGTLKLSRKTFIKGLKEKAKIERLALMEMRKDVTVLKQKLEYARQSVDGIEDLRGDITVLKQKLEETEELLEQIRKFEDLLSETKQDREGKQVEYKGAIQEHKKHKGKLSGITTRKVTKCEFCGGILDSMRYCDLEAHHKNGMLFADVRKKAIKRTILGCDKQILDLQNKIGNLEEIRKNFVPLMKKRERLFKELRIKEKWEASRKSFAEELVRKLDEFKLRRGRLQGYIKNDPIANDLRATIEERAKVISSKEKEMTDSWAEKEVLQMTEEVFETTMREMFEIFLVQLNGLANELLIPVSESSMELSFNPKRETQSKKVVDEINVVLSVNGAESRDIRTYCGGEKGRANICTQLALFLAAESPVGMLFLDEPFVGLDTEGKERVGQMLRERADDGTMIFVITHESQMQRWGGQIKIQRSGGESFIL